MKFMSYNIILFVVVMVLVELTFYRALELFRLFIMP